MTAVVRGRLRYSGADPSRRIIGWAVVIVVHLLVGWLLVTGMARKGLDFIKKPMEAAVIQEVIIPPPPPPPPPPKQIKPPEPKAIKTQAPPPPFVPPPDVPPPVSTSAPAIESVATPPATPPVIAPPPPPAPPAPPQVARQEIGLACPTQVPPDMPRQALRDGTEGVVKAQALIRDGTVREVTILSGPRVFHAAVRNAMLQYRCVSSAGDVLATQEFAFKVD
jgi:protein TonB